MNTLVPVLTTWDCLFTISMSRYLCQTSIRAHFSIDYFSYCTWRIVYRVDSVRLSRMSLGTLNISTHGIVKNNLGKFLGNFRAHDEKKFP